MSEASWIPEPGADATIEKNWLFQLRRERFRSRVSGKSHDFYVLHLADAVQVVALTCDRQVVLVRQFRAGSGCDSLETPGGLVDPGEDVIEAGIRELREETGYEGDTPWILGTVWSNPSIMTSRITTLVITNAVLATEASLDEGEEVEVVLAPAASLPAMVRDGKIQHALAVAGLLWWMAAELPETPMATLPDSGPPWYQFRLKTLVGLVVISAGVFGLLRNLGVTLSVALAFGASIPAAHTVVSRLLDPPRVAALLPDMRGRQKTMQALAIFGLAVVIWGGLLLGLKIAGIL